MDIKQNKLFDLNAIRAKLAGKQGKQYWRSLEELAETPEFLAYLQDEVPQQTRSMESGIDRRKFLTLAGASLALAGLSGCRWLPDKKIVPYVSQPDNVLPGLPLTYATSILRGGYAVGVLATSREFRPVKLEGNPEHPASLGATDAFTQAELLNLYDPDRSQSVLFKGEMSDWGLFFTQFGKQFATTAAKGGLGVRLLTETVTSPTLNDQIQKFLAAYPQAQWHQYEPCGRDNARAGAKLAFGNAVNTVYHFDRADRILSLDADFLMSMPGCVRYARDFSNKRRVRSGTQEINRLYVAETCPTITGSMADHRLPIRASEMQAFATAIAKEVGVDVGVAAGAVPAGVPQNWVSEVAKDLKAHNGTSVVVAGEDQPPAVHYLAHAMNAALGNIGSTVVYTAPIEYSQRDTTQMDSLKTLIADMKAGQVQILLILDGNPVYNAPVDLDFTSHVKNVPLRVHLSLFNDETSEICHWHLPASHSLEMWSDARAYDGTVSIIQPLIEPLYGGKSALELLAQIVATDKNQEVPTSGYDLVHSYWSRQNLPGDFEKTFQKILHDGLIPNTAFPPLTTTLQTGVSLPSAPASQGIEIVFRPDPTIYDGRYSNNGWLQELPKPLTKMTWDNAALMSPAMAERLNLVPNSVPIPSEEKDQPVISLTYQGRTVDAAVMLLPGHPDNSVTLHLGYGRPQAGQLGTGTGFNAYALRTSVSPGFGSGIDIKNTGKTYLLTHTRSHHSMEGRDIVMEATLEGFLKNPNFAKNESTTNPEDENHKPFSMYQKAAETDHKYEGEGAYAWGLSIDNNVCIGCNACVIGCQAENNIPVVGKDQVSRGREMQWIRIDRYYKGNLENPSTVFEPVTCMHCENAPCEPVCPVAATVHSKEGLNQMVYNRCVGTRYCSNNCPYKVRRFNFYKYAAGQPNRSGSNYDLPVIKLSANPEVTIRGRGVMEKCTYCVQRINAARQTAKIEGRTIKDGEIVTACQQACPTNAITFGDIHDPNSEVSKRKAEPHDYTLLGELGTRPRTTYLAKLTNPNPALVTVSNTKAEGE